MSGHSLNCPVITSAAGGPCTCGTINAMDVRSYTVAAPPAPEASSEKDAQTAQMIAGLCEALEAVQFDIEDHHGLNSQSIVDTVWHSPIETTVDFIGAVVAKARGEA